VIIYTPPTTVYCPIVKRRTNSICGDERRIIVVLLEANGLSTRLRALVVKGHWTSVPPLIRSTPKEIAKCGAPCRLVYFVLLSLGNLLAIGHWTNQFRADFSAR